MSVSKSDLCVSKSWSNMPGIFERDVVDRHYSMSNYFGHGPAILSPTNFRVGRHGICVKRFVKMTLPRAQGSRLVIQKPAPPKSMFGNHAASQGGR
jgi:hypothetical protein